jgi:chromosome partitioning protein
VATGRADDLVVNGATPRARITSDAAVALSQHGTVAPAMVTQRVVLASAMIDGRTVAEVDPENRSAAEIATLWDYLADRLNRMANRQAFQRQRPGTRFFGRRTVGDGGPEPAVALGEVA